MGPMYVAPTVEQAIEECRYGLKWVMDYISHIVPTDTRRVDALRGAGRRR